VSPPQIAIPAVFMRGGTSKGVFFHARDLPADRAAQAPILLAALGSPDPYGRQLDGLGGGISSLSKAVVIGSPTRADADVDYTFAQVAVDRPVVDWGSNCGNLSSAVGPFAVDEGLVTPSEAGGEMLVRIHQTNTRRLIHARFPVCGGRAEVAGDFAVAGVAGTGARIRLDFLSPGGGATGALLPTGCVVDELTLPGEGRFRASLVDAANPMAILAAADLGLGGTETPEEIEARPGLMALLDRLRRVAAVTMGMARTSEAAALAVPKIAVVAPPAPYHAIDGAAVPAGSHDIAARVVSMERPHRAVPLTAAMCLGVACCIEGTIPNLLAGGFPSGDEVRIGTPSGVLSAGAEVRWAGGSWHAESAVVYRTARRLMQGQVLVPMRG
jgi:2-methylaconitate cis-trans-isomerase PrpF